MVGVLEGFATIAVIVAVGWILADRRVLDDAAQVNLSRLAFYVASPALLLTVMQRTSLDAVLSANLVTSLISFAVIVGLYLLVARFRWAGATLGSRLIGSLSAAYVNAGNLGIPIALYVLGDVAWVAPTLLMQLLIITPVYMALFDSDARGERPTLGAASVGCSATRSRSVPWQVSSSLSDIDLRASWRHRSTSSVRWRSRRCSWRSASRCAAARAPPPAVRPSTSGSWSR